jgi:putative membrane-bound dehydrogenase-like protein
MPRFFNSIFILATLAFVYFGCTVEEKFSSTSIEEVADNEEVAAYMQAFEGRGDLADSSQPTPAAKALTNFRHPNDLKLELVLSEPDIHQPLDISFDHRGRLWVVQYNQYPYPEGVKVTGVDHHLRLKFDQVPAPPPEGVQGADKITFFEDTDGDGTYDKATNAITGLNITTGVALGRKKLWVLSPPYLLAYPDPDRDGLPDGEPEVQLEGFGLEDTHAVANSLRWGPDGWLYGAQGSTTTANISSEATKNVSFMGQAIWRYHPETQVFEIFAEGGGNTFDVEIDEKGRIFSGDNGVDRGMYYKQGAYYQKNWGKHGALTNPYAFGYLPNMELEGEKKRFTHAWIKYNGGSLPDSYQGDIIAINPLQSYLQLTRLEKVGSTFRNVDEDRILETNDHWFRPVDIKTGPDGAVYLADWYDSRLSHVDPRDTWHKASGRIYRLMNSEASTPSASFDLSKYTNDQLIELLAHKNKWFRQQALRQFGNRKDPTVIPKLLPLLQSDSGQLALEALWAINLSGGFTDDVANVALQHTDPFVRMWGVRLLGDAKQVSSEMAEQLARLAEQESHAEVRSQLAASAKRLPPEAATPIIRGLLTHEEDIDDRDNPMLIWWALEAQAETDREAVLSLFEDQALWSNPIVQKVLLPRVMQRYVMDPKPENMQAVAQLLALAPENNLAKPLLDGLQEGLRGRDINDFPTYVLDALQPYQSMFGEAPLALELQQGKPEVVDQVLGIIANQAASTQERLSYIRILGGTGQPKAIPVLLEVAESGQSSGAIKQAAIQALQRYGDPDIGTKLIRAYPDKLRADPDVRLAALQLFASRPARTQQLLRAIDETKQISQDDVPPQLVTQFRLLNEPAITATVDRIWQETQLASASDKTQRVAQVVNVLRANSGNAIAGKSIYQSRCGSCHQLFGDGGDLGPDLTGYDRRNVDELLLNIVDPNASIREGYVNYLIETEDGRSLLGTIRERSGNTVTIQPFGGEEITLSNDQILSMQAQPTSLMPERLLDGLTEQQLSDLFAYIQQTK